MLTLEGYSRQAASRAPSRRRPMARSTASTRQTRRSPAACSCAWSSRARARPDTRRRAQLSELLPADGDERRVGTVLDTMVGARLVTMDDAGVEVAHEALIREWPRLQSWLDEDRDSLRLQRHLARPRPRGTSVGQDSKRALPRAAAVGRPRLAGDRTRDLRAGATVPRREPRGRGAAPSRSRCAPTAGSAAAHRDRGGARRRARRRRRRASSKGASDRPHATGPRWHASRPSRARSSSVNPTSACCSPRRRSASRRRRDPQHAALRSRGASVARRPALRRRVWARGDGVHARRRAPGDADVRRHGDAPVGDRDARQVDVLRNKNEILLGVAVSPDGRWLVVPAVVETTAGVSGRLQVWDLETRTLDRVVPEPLGRTHVRVLQRRRRAVGHPRANRDRTGPPTLASSGVGHLDVGADRRPVGPRRGATSDDRVHHGEPRWRAARQRSPPTVQCRCGRGRPPARWPTAAPR